MISLSTLFWLMIFLFAVVGALRGWTKEVIATSGLVLSLFAINFLGFRLIEFVSNGSSLGTPMEKQHFYMLAFIHVLITFFSYQGPAIAGARIRDRLRIRDSVQDKVLGSLIGGLNGYLFIGSLWAFLEYRVIGQGQWIRLDVGLPYAFDPSTIVRPVLESNAFSLMERLPIPLLSDFLPILVVVVFLFVIVVMI